MKKSKHNYGENAQFFTAPLSMNKKGVCSKWVHTKAKSLGVAKAIATNRDHLLVGVLKNNILEIVLFKENVNGLFEWRVVGGI